MIGGSLRSRVTWTVAVVLGVVLIVLGIVVNTLSNAVINRSLNAVLTDRVQLAQQLARQNASPAALLERVDNRSVHARLELPDGRVMGSLQTHPVDEATVKVRHVTLSGPGKLNRAKLTLDLDTRLLSGAKAKLVRVTAVAALGAMLVVLLGLPVAVKRALAPLDSMTSLARDIARGRRGERLTPARTNSEIGRTAAAFDEMLDALEGAEARAQNSEERTRSFVADAAHELRTPIAGISAIAEAIVQQSDTDSELPVLLVREAHRAGRLVEDLLDLARIDVGLTLRRADTDLTDLAQAQVDRVRLLHPEIHATVTGPRLIADVDATRISQILANLLNNACRAAQPAGEVTVALREWDSSIEISVSDSGPGVPPEDRERIFDRLVRLDTARAEGSDTAGGTGSGLGLTIARGIARAHGGDLTCHGATFILTLPRNGLEE